MDFEQHNWSVSNFRPIWTIFSPIWSISYERLEQKDCKIWTVHLPIDIFFEFYPKLFFHTIFDLLGQFGPLWSISDGLRQVQTCSFLTLPKAVSFSWWLFPRCPIFWRMSVLADCVATEGDSAPAAIIIFEKQFEVLPLCTGVHFENILSGKNWKNWNSTKSKSLYTFFLYEI